MFFYALEKVGGKKAAMDLYLEIADKPESSASYTSRMNSRLLLQQEIRFKAGDGLSGA